MTESATPPAIFITAPEGGTGKSTVALGLLRLLAASDGRVGVFRPITRMGEDRDYILELLIAHTTAGLSYDECVGVGYQQLHDDPDSALADWPLAVLSWIGRLGVLTALLAGAAAVIGPPPERWLAPALLLAGGLAVLAAILALTHTGAA